MSEHADRAEEVERAAMREQREEDRLKRMEERLAALEAALEAVEWVDDDPPRTPLCPSCREEKDFGHAPDCQLAKALTDAKGPLPAV
jgi:hypothetical protein